MTKPEFRISKKVKYCGDYCVGSGLDGGGNDAANTYPNFH